MPQHEDFEAFLTLVCADLTALLRSEDGPRTSAAFQAAVEDALAALGQEHGFTLDGRDHPHVFPDFSLGEYGVEVKFSDKDTWRSVGNSIFEGQRSPGVRHIYIVFGKAGGQPEVRFARYDTCIIHVRTSHVPRFEVDVSADKPLFGSALDTTYEEFSGLTDAEKMTFIRKYARSRLKEGERLWWLSDESNSDHAVPLTARLYTSLGPREKITARAEAALLCPGIVAGSRARKKYDDVALYLVTYRGILAHQVRDLFSAGSVALKSDETRGGNYLLRALRDLEPFMIEAAEYLPDSLFVEYWGQSCEPDDRIRVWLAKADRAAADWTPSEEMFLDR